MEREAITLGHGYLEAEVLDEPAVQSRFGLLERGWPVKAIARELGMAGNTVRSQGPPRRPGAERASPEAQGLRLPGPR